MTWAQTTVQKTLFDILSADATLQTLLGGSVGNTKIYDIPPQDAAYPFVTLQINPWTDRGSHTTEGWDADPQINVWYRAPNSGLLKTQQIQARIDFLIHNKNPDICFDGWNVIVLRRSFVDILVQPDNVTLQGVQRFKLLLGEVQ
jgi:hypothetical protein